MSSRIVVVMERDGVPPQTQHLNVNQSESFFFKMSTVRTQQLVFRTDLWTKSAPLLCFSLRSGGLLRCEQELREQAVKCCSIKGSSRLEFIIQKDQSTTKLCHGIWGSCQPYKNAHSPLQHCCCFIFPIIIRCIHFNFVFYYARMKNLQL